MGHQLRENEERFGAMKATVNRVLGTMNFGRDDILGEGIGGRGTSTTANGGGFGGGGGGRGANPVVGFLMLFAMNEQVDGGMEHKSTGRT